MVRDREEIRVSPRHEGSNLQELRVSQHHLVDVQLWDDQWSGKSDILHENVVHFHNDLYKEAIEAADQQKSLENWEVDHLRWDIWEGQIETAEY